MDADWAAKHLLVIRTLMERAALYRQTLAPIMLRLGGLGIVAGIIGWRLAWGDHRIVVGYWMGIGLVGVGWAYGLARRQALIADEPFWSPPTRRVTQAILPPLGAGTFAGAWMLSLPRDLAPAGTWYLPVAWMIFYGCAMHAAGFFMPRGMKLFGWLFIGCGCLAAIGLRLLPNVLPLRWIHVFMGTAFGGLHMAYGLYLRWTENKSISG
jgi:hypothetical protein